MMSMLFSSSNTLGNVFGLLAMLSAVGVYTYKSRKKILFAKLVADFLWAMHFFLIEANTGGMLNAVNVVRDGIFYNKDNKKWASKSYWVLIFFVLNIVSGIASWQGVISLMPMVGSSVAIIGLWRSEPAKLRTTSLIAIILWLIYAAVNHSLTSFIYNSIAICSIIAGMIRDYKKA